MLTLAKADGPADLTGVTKMAVGTSWDQTAGTSGGALGWAKRRKGVDLDLIAILMMGDDPVAFAGLDSLDPLQNGSVTHSGDNQTGAGAGDDETVSVEFANIPSAYDKIIFVAAAFKKGTSFEKANNVRFTVYDGSNGSTAPVATIPNSLLGTHNIYAVAKATRVGVSWQLEVIGDKSTIKQGDKQALLRYAISK